MCYHAHPQYRQKFLPPNPLKRRYLPYHRIRPLLQQSSSFCCMNSFISLWADIVSGTIGTSFTLSLQSTGFLNISDEWMIYRPHYLYFRHILWSSEIPDSTKQTFQFFQWSGQVYRYHLGTRDDTVTYLYIREIKRILEDLHLCIQFFFIPAFSMLTATK